MATKTVNPPVGTAESVPNKSELSLAEILRNVESLHRYRQGFGLYSHQENRFLTGAQIEAYMNVPLPENNYKPMEPSAETLLMLINDLVFSDVKTIRFFLPLVRRKYRTSMPSDPDMIDTLITKFQHLHLVCKREQRAGKTEYQRPFAGLRVACVCITPDGARFVASKYLHPSTDVKGLSLSQLDETAAYSIVVSNFLLVAFARTYIPDSMDPYYQTIEIHFPKYKYIRDYADDFGNTSLSPGRVIFPSREIDGVRTRRKACIFTSQLLGYNSALVPSEDFNRHRKHMLEMARWSAAREKSRSEDGEIVETAVFIAVENMESAVRIKDELIALLRGGEIDHIYLTSEAAIDEICVRRRCVLLAALIELREDENGEYKYRTPDATFFR